MGDETSRLPPMRLMNFITEEQLDQSKEARGERVEDGTASRDRPLFEILKENKDKRDAEFNERFKHRPPKALDEDETEFLDILEKSRSNYEKKMAEEEAQQLLDFQAAVAAQSNIVHELQDKPPVPKVQVQKPAVKKNAHPYNFIIKAKPHAKKAKVDPTVSEGLEIVKTPSHYDTQKASDLEKKSVVVKGDEAHNIPANSLVSYSDESEDDD